MTTETYQDLREAVQAIVDASRHAADESFLDEWRRWARGFVSGLYCARTALRAADSAFVEADECARVQPLLSRVAMAAALVARGVAHAASREDAAARAKAAAANTLIERIDPHRFSSKVANETFPRVRILEG